MKKETFDRYVKILKRKDELKSTGMKTAEIMIKLSDEFCLSESMINEILYAKRRKMKMERYMQNEM